MIHRFLLLLVVILLNACAGDAPPADVEADASTNPAPPSGDERYDLLPSRLAEYPTNYVKGCACELRLEGAEEDDLFFVFQGQSDGPGVLGLGGGTHFVEPGAILSSGTEQAGYRSYLHESGAYRVQTSLTERTDEGDGKAMTGRCRVTDKRTGEKLEVEVTGRCGC